MTSAESRVLPTKISAPKTRLAVQVQSFLRSFCRLEWGLGVVTNPIARRNRTENFGRESSHDPASICTAQRRLYSQRSGPLFALRSSRHRLLPALFRYVQRTNGRLVHARARLRLCRANYGQSVRISVRSHRMRLQGSEPNG